MAGQVVKVKSDKIEACMTCPLCKKLLRDATTISLCLHTFCRKCIYERLSDEEVDCCPVCNIDLGCLPVEKLRPDHNLQDIRAKIFPFKRRKIRAPEAMPSVALPAKRKERSLSSLVVSTPKVPMQTGFTGRRSKASARKAGASRCSFMVDESNKKEDSAEDNPMSSSSPDSHPIKTVQNKRQDSSVVDSLKTQRNAEEQEDDVEIIEGKTDLWTPLNCLVEAANRSKSSKSNSQGLSHAKSDLLGAPDCEFQSPRTKSRAGSPNGYVSEVYMSKTKNKEYGQEMKVHHDKNGENSLQATGKRRRITSSRKRLAMSAEFGPSAQLVVEAGGVKNSRRTCPIWFSLKAHEEMKGDAYLPQISAGFLRIKDGKMPVSFICKYLAKKLDLRSEDEVELECRGEPLPLTLQLHNLVDLWYQRCSTTRRLPALVGSSAKDFIMVLKYYRKIQAS